MTRSELKARARQKLGGGLFQQNWLYSVLATLIFSALVSISSAAVIGPILLTGPLTYGLSYLYLKQSRTGNKMELAEIFEGFKADFVGNFLLGFLQSLFIALWSMLFVIPGIVKQYSWSMAYYVKIDHPDYDWRACLDESKRITMDHKSELFLLDLSFIGWAIVCVFTFGIGYFWLIPYMTATKAEYYEALRGKDTFTE